MTAKAGLDGPPWPGRATMADGDAIQRMGKFTLAAVPTAVSCARAFVRCFLGRWGLDSLVETAELVTSELVTNAVKMTGTMDTSSRCAVLGEINVIQVRLVLVRHSAFVCVWDRDINPPVVREPDLDAESGRGVFLVDAMCENWGYLHPRLGGKFVWCEYRAIFASDATFRGVRDGGKTPDGVGRERRHAATLGC